VLSELLVCLKSPQIKNDSSSPRERRGDIDLDPNRIRTQFSDKASAKTNHTEALSVRNTVTNDMKLKIHEIILKPLKKNLKKKLIIMLEFQ